jgi:hypothetical protein
MSDLATLWLPILAAAFAVFVASALVHMVLRWHNSDYRGLANEDAVAAALRGNAAPGMYMLPHCMDGKALQDEAMQRRFREGPVALITLRRPAAPTMGPYLAQWFVLNLVLAATVALMMFHLVGNDAHRAACTGGFVTFLAYSVGSLQAGIWYGKPWGVVAKELVDGAIYGAVTAAVFFYLWPGA